MVVLKAGNTENNFYILSSLFEQKRLKRLYRIFM